MLGLATLAAYMRIGIMRIATASVMYRTHHERDLHRRAGHRRCLAGLRLAISARRRGHDAIILSLVPAKRSHSKARGGMQASLGNVSKGQGDNEDVHFEDTVRPDWGADQEVVRMFVNTRRRPSANSPPGRSLDAHPQGDRQVINGRQKVTITERVEADGLLSQRDFGGTKKWRTCYVATEPGTRCSPS